MTLHSIGLGASAPTEFETITKAFGRDETSSTQLTLQHRICCCCRSMNYHRNIRQLTFHCRNCIHYAKGLIFCSAWNFGEQNFSRLLIKTDYVGKSTANINANQIISLLFNFFYHSTKPQNRYLQHSVNFLRPKFFKLEIFVSGEIGFDPKFCP